MVPSGMVGIEFGQGMPVELFANAAWPPPLLDFHIKSGT